MSGQMSGEEMDRDYSARMHADMWWLTKSAAQLRAMAAADGNVGPTLLGANPSWAELIRAAEERERA